MQRGTREYALWSIAIALVLIFALIPVIWIMALSLKTPASVADGRFLPPTGRWTTTRCCLTAGSATAPS